MMPSINIQTGPLRKDEQRELAKHEKVIEHGMKTFVDVGRALLAIRDNERKLYREHGTFEKYCNERWGFSRIHAHRLISAAKVTEALPMGNKPTGERQARELARLPDDQQAECWQDYTEECEQEDVKPTAKGLREKVEVWLGDNDPIDVEAEPEDEDVEVEEEPEQEDASIARIRELAHILANEKGAAVAAAILENIAEEIRNS